MSMAANLTHGTKAQPTGVTMITMNEEAVRIVAMRSLSSHDTHTPMFPLKLNRMSLQF